jgi:hypothetical protein
MSSEGASSTKVAPWSGRLIRIRDTRNFAAPIATSDPMLTPSAAARRDSGQTSPIPGMLVASVGAPNGSSES